MSAKLIFIVIVFTVWILQGQSVTAANRTACKHNKILGSLNCDIFFNVNR